MLHSDFDCVGGWCPSPLLFKGQLYLLSTHQRIIPDARSRALGQFPLVSTREDTRETELSTFRTSLPGPQTAGASARCLCWAPSPRPGPPASETARVLDTQPSPSSLALGDTRGDTGERRVLASRTRPLQSHSAEGPPPRSPSYLESRAVHVFGQFHANPVCHDEAVIGVDLSGERRQFAPGSTAPRDERAERRRGEGHTCVCTGHTFHGKSTTKGTFNLAVKAGRGQSQHAGGPLPCTL